MSSTPPSGIAKVLLSHPTGNSNTRAVAEALHREQLLQSFQTCLAVGNDSRDPFKNRLFAPRKVDVPDALIQTHPWREFIRLLSEKSGLFPGIRSHERGACCVDRIYRHLDASVARKIEMDFTDEISAVYAYEDGACATFSVAAQKQLHCFYDLPIGYWRAARRIQRTEAERHPEWRDTMPALVDSEDKLLRKDEELKQADTVIVASEFTARTLSEAPFPVARRYVVPYPCPPTIRDPDPSKAPGQKLKVIFVGSLSQRKGLADLIDACKIAKDEVDLTIIGRRVANCRPLDAALKRHRWIESFPHSQILREMREHDVLIFPSLFEGFGLVVTEALSQGIPVIATDHTCAPDIIQEGREGFIVPIRAPQAIAEKLIYLNENPDKLREMKKMSLARAKSLTSERYAAQLLGCIRERLQA